MTSPDRLHDIVRSYFSLADARDPRSGDLFADDIEFYFPGFGVGKGKAQLAAFSQGYRKGIVRIHHLQEAMTLTVSGTRVFVEGITEGETPAGTWEGGKTPGGRFCSVFDVRDEKIVRMYIYVDPDYNNQNKLGFEWSEDQHAHW